MLSNAQAAIANVNQLKNSIQTLVNNLSKAKTTAQVLKIVLNSLGGRLSVVAVALSAILYFYPPKEIKELDDEFKKIEDRVKKSRRFYQGNERRSKIWSFRTACRQI